MAGEQVGERRGAGAADEAADRDERPVAARSAKPRRRRRGAAGAAAGCGRLGLRLPFGDHPPRAAALDAGEVVRGSASPGGQIAGARARSRVTTSAAAARPVPSTSIASTLARDAGPRCWGSAPAWAAAWRELGVGLADARAAASRSSWLRAVALVQLPYSGPPGAASPAGVVPASGKRVGSSTQLGGNAAWQLADRRRLGQRRRACRGARLGRRGLGRVRSVLVGVVAAAQPASASASEQRRRSGAVAGGAHRPAGCRATKPVSGLGPSRQRGPDSPALGPQP